MPLRPLAAALALAVMAGAAVPAERTPLSLSRAVPAAAATAGDARVIVKFKSDAAAVRARALSARADAQTVAAVLDERANVLGGRVGLALRAGAAVGDRGQVVTASGLTGAQLAARLAADPDVEYAEVDQRMRRLAVPNDPLYTTGGANGPVVGQWYLKPSTVDAPAAANVEQAWDITQGSASIVVAVLDTGVRRDHPDLTSKLLDGYDMISDTATANDGGGRDADPSDPGDYVTTAEVNQVGGSFYHCVDANNDGSYTGEASSWHGTQVAGIVGASTNDGTGMAGTGWNVRVLPVRVLGKCGGFVSDIADAMRWAAGLHVTGVPDLPADQKARVINLSLGGSGACSSTYQQAVNDVTAAGVVVVAAAGNSNGQAVGQPADCTGVIGVTAVRHVGTKVGFADVGPQIAIAAPGGNCVNETGPCLYPILSATNTGTQGPGAPSYTDSLDAAVGTSFSSPIVAGAAALMLSVQPNLTPAQVKSVLQATARPFPTTGGTAGIAVCAAPSSATQDECYCTTSTCGAGMLDAHAAVAALVSSAAQLQAHIGYTPTAPTAGQAVTLSAGTSTVGTGLAIASYAWSVVDGAGVAAFSGATNAASATLATSAAGTVTVRLTITDTAGSTASADQAITVAAAASSGGSSGGGGGGAFSVVWLALLGAATLRVGRPPAR